jgi:thiamine biosynthesis protein ThiI
VASQTAENLRFTGSYTDLPLFRPLVGTDKEETVTIAKRIGSYETSILPYEDCCVLFSPTHPLLKADYAEEREAYAGLDLGPFIQKAIRGAEKLNIPFGLTLP